MICDASDPHCASDCIAAKTRLMCRGLGLFWTVLGSFMSRAFSRSGVCPTRASGPLWAIN